MKRFFRQRQQQPNPSFNTFILEPILTPSGLMDAPGDDTPDPSLLSDLFNDLDGDDLTDTPNDFDPGFDEEIEVVSFFNDETPESPFNAGVFTVDDSGQVGIDFLYDGGGYKGELAIFSLEGMEDLDPGSEEFIEEAARRALTNSTEGHIVIQDASEGAKFEGKTAWEANFNGGDYKGVKTVEMNPGETFGVMLVPRGTVQQVYDNPDIGGATRPLFSMQTLNPNDAFHVGQIADVTGDGNTFVMEDLRVDGWTDQDYNDIIFQVRGATAEATHIDDVIDADRDWRTSDMGQALIEYAKPYVDIDGHDHAHTEGDLPDEILFDPDSAPTIIPAEPDSYEFPETDQPLVGVIDTGFSDHNPYLDYQNIQVGQDWIDNDANSLLQPGEGSEHGTHVLGTITTANSDAPLWAGRAVGSGQWANSLTEFVDAAIDSGQPNAVVNLSFDLIDETGAVRTEFTPTEWDALEYAHQNNVIIVAATGNDAGTISALGQASQHFDNIVTVGAAEYLDTSLSVPKGVDRAYYSSYGDSVDLVAFGGTPDNPILAPAGDGIKGMAGTSVATAKVTGAISQVWAANPDLSYQQVVDILQRTATDLLKENWDAQTGSGLLNMAAAVHLAKATEPESPVKTLPVAPTTWTTATKPTERPVSITEVAFSGKVSSTIGANVRSTPNRNLSPVGKRNYGASVNFDAWTVGEFISYPGLGNSNLWYRIAGTTNQWISGAIIDGGPPNTTTPTYDFEFNGKQYNWVSYTIKPGDTLSHIALRTMGNHTASAYNLIAQKNGIANPNLIYAGATILVPKEVGSSTPGQPTPKPTPVDPNKFYHPLPGYPVTSEFGPRDESAWGGDGWHNGIDLGTSGTTPAIKAAKGGTVVIARYGWNDGYGNYVKIDHGNGLETRYAHLSSISVQPGQTVSAGTHIGNVGTTGISTGNHLHFEIRVNGVAKNPRNYIQF